jgi:hypothetical protein
MQPSAPAMILAGPPVIPVQRKRPISGQSRWVWRGGDSAVISGRLDIMTGADGKADRGARPGWRWDVALSFADAQRDYVEQVAGALTAQRVRCFYDADEQIELWGKYLAEELPTIYGEQAAAVVVFVSAEYAARDWTRLERRAALNRAVQERREYMLPARFDDTPLPGLLSDMVAVELRSRTPQQFAVMIAAKLADLGIDPRPTGRISSPRNGSEVDLHEEVSGVANLPPDAEAWIVVRPIREGTNWPQYNLSKGHTGNFQVPRQAVQFGGERTEYSGERYDLRLVMAPPDASARFREFPGEDASRGMLELPDGVELLDQVTVKRLLPLHDRAAARGSWSCPQGRGHALSDNRFSDSHVECARWSTTEISARLDAVTGAGSGADPRARPP